MAWLSSKVKVILIDDATGRVFAVTRMPPEDLPESLDLETTLHLDDVDWSVVEATPATRAEYARSRKLTLRLRRLELADPDDILYSLPSICDVIPAVGDRPVAVDDYALREDDWRQVELVSRRHAAAVDAEIAAILDIHRHHAATVGWRRVHVRTWAETPVVNGPTLDELLEAVPGTRHGVSYAGASTVIESGFAIRAGADLTLNGLAPDGTVTVLAIVEATGQSVTKLVPLAREFELDLVHWCRCARVGPDPESYRGLIEVDAGGTDAGGSASG